MVDKVMQRLQRKKPCPGDVLLTFLNNICTKTVCCSTKGQKLLRSFWEVAQKLYYLQFLQLPCKCTIVIEATTLLQVSQRFEGQQCLSRRLFQFCYQVPQLISSWNVKRWARWQSEWCKDAAWNSVQCFGIFDVPDTESNSTSIHSLFAWIWWLPVSVESLWVQEIELQEIIAKKMIT